MANYQLMRTNAGVLRLVGAALRSSRWSRISMPSLPLNKIGSSLSFPSSFLFVSSFLLYTTKSVLLLSIYNTTVCIHMPYSLHIFFFFFWRILLKLYCLISSTMSITNTHLASRLLGSPLGLSPSAHCFKFYNWRLSFIYLPRLLSY